MEQTIRQIIALLKKHKLTISAAESCTGGLLAAAITSVPGASEVFEGSVVSYANKVKQRILGVDEQILKTCGAVSAACAEAMASGVRAQMNADMSVSITGIAGPEGGTSRKPVGTVFIGMSTDSRAALTAGTAAREFHFSGGRCEIRQASVEQTLIWGIVTLKKLDAHRT